MKKLIDKSLEGVKANLLPGIILQVFALALVAGYYNLESINSFCAKVADLKVEHGFLFSGLSTALFGGVIPFIFLILMKKAPSALIISHGIFFFIFGFIKGMEVDLLYRCQALMFGTETTAPVIVKKVLFDQFVYNMFYAAGMMTLCYLWKDSGFSFKKFRENCSKEVFTLTIPSVLFSTWIVWIPATAIIYSLPAPLQIPLFNIVLCFFVLLVSFLCKTEEKEEVKAV